MGRKELFAALLFLVMAALAWRAFFRSGDTPEKAALRLEAGAEVPAIGLDRLGRREAGAAPPRATSSSSAPTRVPITIPSRRP